MKEKKNNKIPLTIVGKFKEKIDKNAFGDFNIQPYHLYQHFLNWGLSGRPFFFLSFLLVFQLQFIVSTILCQFQMAEIIHPVIIYSTDVLIFLSL